ncbi:hypothetical protein O6H91_17G041400 [Diphasiastrum complanatum]|uniref:Uncharacterized protein n=1 Tax=Diphasiastrum complanatum TaxID=34168 RepID=A0ACC2B615_DIPCM|nr:hypothetical protein O6H91_17G041400 [Diphasiastrum complanatum]
MEVGNSKDIWFKNCVDLVLARFCESDYAPFGITGVNVLKVMRIHNRLLQDRWEQQYERKVMKSKKRHAEYLLYGEALQCPNEFQRILEEGFPFFRGLFNQGFPRPVLLSNSIGLADVQRLQAISEKWQIFNNGRIRASGWLLVVKAFLGYSAQDLTVNFASPTTKKCTYPGADSVYKLHPTDSNQCSWLVFDSSLVVPEYLLEFKYNFKHEAASADPISQGDPKLQRSTSLKVLEEFLPRKGRGTWHCLPLDDPVRAAGKPKLLSDGIIDVHSPRHSSIVSEIFCHLSSSLILRNSNIKDLSKVTHLNLHNCNITNIETLEGLKNLEVLLLSFNKVTRMKGFAQLEVLKKLDLSYNLVKRIEVLEAVSNLVRLDLAGNEISVIEDIERLHSQIPALLHLSLKNNPIEERIGYRQMVLKAVPSLVKLDGISVAAG